MDAEKVFRAFGGCVRKEERIERKRNNILLTGAFTGGYCYSTRNNQEEQFKR